MRATVPSSYDWTELWYVVYHVYGEPGFWLVSLLVIVLVLAPRTIGKSYDTINMGRISARRRFRIVFEKQRSQVEEVKEAMCNSEMSMPAADQMNRYRQTHRCSSSTIACSLPCLSSERMRISPLAFSFTSMWTKRSARVHANQPHLSRESQVRRPARSHTSALRSPPPS